MIRELILATAVAALSVPALAGGITLNEIRIDQPGADVDEYIELLGPPKAPLGDLWIVSIGDGTAGSGVVESAISLSGQVIPADGHFLIAEDAFTIGEVTDLIPKGANPLNFENSDNLTFLLVDDFTGMVDDDLDTDDDGVFDVEPWAEIVDCVSLIETPGAGDQTYCTTEVGPDGPFVPGHVFFCSGANGEWQIGAFDPASLTDTPGLENPACDVVPQTDVTVFKNGPSVVLDGNNAVYEISVQNFGSDPAENVTIVDTLPAGVTFVSAMSPADVTLDDSTPPTIEWSMTGDLEGLGERIITLEVTLGPGLGGTIVTNVVDVATTSPDDLDNNTDSVDTTVQNVIVNIPDVRISEIRTDDPSGGDDDEYFELVGNPGQSLDGLTYLVIGDGAAEAGSGVIEEIVPLTGLNVPADGHFICSTDTLTLAALPSVDLVVPALGFENGDNTTHLLVANFAGSLLDDLDADDDGQIDSPTPWSDVLDAVGLLRELGEPTFTEYAYGADLGFEDVGPDGNQSPAHVYRCAPTTSWAIGPFDFDADDDGTPDGDDTPGVMNGACTVSLSVDKRGAFAAAPGASFTYTIEVTNGGKDSLPPIDVMDTLPAGVTFVSESSSAAVVFTDMTPPSLAWQIPTLDAGVTETILVEVSVDAGTSGSIMNTVEVSARGIPGDDPADNVATATTLVSGVVDPPEDVVINEIRTSQIGDDTDEFFELAGDPGLDLEGVSYLVIGDGTAEQGSGVVECVVPLAGNMVQADGFFLAAEDTLMLAGTADLTLVDDPDDPDDALNFEGSDNVTHLLVANFTGGPGDDLDTDDDGTLDVIPWSTVIDAVGLLEEVGPPMNTEFAYGAALGFEDIGPDDVFVPGLVYRCSPAGTWTIGVFDPVGTDDTPDAANASCDGSPPCGGDTNNDGEVDVNDLNNVVLDWGTDGSANGGDITGPLPGSPPDGVVNVNDLNAVIVNWGLCP